MTKLTTEERIAALGNRGTSFVRLTPLQAALRALDAESQVTERLADAHVHAAVTRARDVMLEAVEEAVGPGDFVKLGDAAKALGLAERTLRYAYTKGPVTGERRGRSIWVSFPSAERYARRGG